MKLELKHLAEYLPYGLKYKNNFFEDKRITELTPFLLSFHSVDFNKIKLILRPLSDLAKDIEVNGEKFKPIDKLDEIESDVCSYSIDYYINYTRRLPYYRVQKLLEWHFDIYGLIEKGLAIDINTLNK